MSEKRKLDMSEIGGVSGGATWEDNGKKKGYTVHSEYGDFLITGWAARLAPNELTDALSILELANKGGTVSKERYNDAVTTVLNNEKYFVKDSSNTPVTEAMYRK